MAAQTQSVRPLRAAFIAFTCLPFLRMVAVLESPLTPRHPPLPRVTDMGGFGKEKGQRRNKKTTGMETAEAIGRARGRRAVDVSA
jgi:hypothetical protein